MQSSQGIVLINQVLKDNLFDSLGIQKVNWTSKSEDWEENTETLKSVGYNSEITLWVQK